MSQQNLHYQPRLDNTHTTFVNCLRNWDDPFLNGYKPLKSVGCARCESCGCRLNQQQTIENSNTSGNLHSIGTISLTCSSSSENSHCAKFDSNAQLNNNSDNSSHRHHYLCNTNSNLNRNLSVNNISRGSSVASRAEVNLQPSKFQPIVR